MDACTVCLSCDKCIFAHAFAVRRREGERGERGKGTERDGRRRVERRGDRKRRLRRIRRGVTDRQRRGKRKLKGTARKYPPTFSH